jgi:desampylase
MAIYLSSKLHCQLIAWAHSAGDCECCGLLFGSNYRVVGAQLADNVASDPSQNFEIDPLSLITAEKQTRQGGSAILGYFHSHPNGIAKPSSTDQRMAQPDGRVWVIIGSGQLTAWLPVADERGTVEFNELIVSVEG